MASTNALKVRDDHRLVRFNIKDGTFDRFVIEDGSAAPEWAGASEFGIKELRQRVEPWLTSLFQSEHLTLLAGSGLTHAVHALATGQPAAGMGGQITTGRFKHKVENAALASAHAAGRSAANIEDRIRVANELHRGLEIFGASRHADALRHDLENALRDFSRSILQSETNIVGADADKRDSAFQVLVSFLMSFASRTGTRDRLHIFTTNYDRLLEAGADLAGLHLMDRFVGSLTPIFRASRLDLDMHYNPPGIRGEPRYLEGVARFTKLHGSVDWVQVGPDIRRFGVPFGAGGVEPYLAAPGLTGADASRLMIFPNAAKDRETAEYPYVELFRDFAAAACRPNSTLVTYGYSFGDEHVNRVVRDMLTIPSTHLVVISRSDTLGRIEPLSSERRSQVSLLLGPQLADLRLLTEHFLPKAAIDKATFRMSELLRQRFGTEARAAGRPDGDASVVAGGLT